MKPTNIFRINLNTKITALVLLFFLGVSALFGGYMLVSDPSGKSLGMPLELLKGTPFIDYLIPGLILFLLIGVSSIIIAFLNIKSTKSFPLFISLQGGILIIWLTVQLILNNDFFFPDLHVPYYVIGALLVGLGWRLNNLENSYKKDLEIALNATGFTEEIIIQKDLDALPTIIQKYLNYVGALGKPVVKNVKIVFEGVMRDQGKDWFGFTSEQYNFFDHPTRLFFMKAKIKGLPVSGYHAYNEEQASMIVKVLSLFPVVHIKGEELYPTETVTFFNDLCMFVPTALIDKRIQWETLDTQSVKATFTNNNTSISAILYFNETGQLVNFISNDRYSVSKMKAFPFSTPTNNYKNINGYNLPTYGEAIWHYPEGEFVYGKFQLQSIEYNVVPKIQ